MTNQITSFTGKYEFLSNFSVSAIFMDGTWYDTVEHFYQTSKSSDSLERHFINSSSTPVIAKQRGSMVVLGDDWATERYNVMLTGVRAKFKQHPDLAVKLLSTGDALLVEGNHWHDNYWGDCNCADCAGIVGDNNLGKILMLVREEVKRRDFSTSPKLEKLMQSLEKKQAKLDELFDKHFKSVGEANGQPLNDKSNGAATVAKWNAQSDAIRRQEAEIEKTQEAITAERKKLADMKYWYKHMPAILTNLIDEGVLVQWRRYPHILFVNGVDKARIVFDGDTGGITYRYVEEIQDKEQYAIFRDVYNGIREAWGL